MFFFFFFDELVDLDADCLAVEVLDALADGLLEDDLLDDEAVLRRLLDDVYRRE